ncbi:anti-anti-sigma factor [Motilibacter rhizosphaerae]|uniref:Anti-anti-sigma factor n=1 Tax=Motilibacter rhizosphaerae TaxID=598652 RepID=A0A4Q7NXC1_9ACTN|nr:DUF6307 family protein [Motilibacter rhizosphaerae]RZS91640.1 anti-anti-sigma factor [Motilibacter rhizosphaerae]
MSVTTRATRRAGATVITVEGELANADVVAWRQALNEHVEAAPGPVVVDLSALSGWGTQAQAVLLQLLRHERAAGRVVSVTGLNGAVARQAHESGMTNLLIRPPGRGPGWLTGLAFPALANRARGTVPAARDHDEEPGTPALQPRATGEPPMTSTASSHRVTGTQYQRRVDLATQALVDHSELSEAVARVLAVHVLDAVDRIPERVR